MLLANARLRGNLSEQHLITREPPILTDLDARADSFLEEQRAAAAAARERLAARLEALRSLADTGAEET